MDTARAARTHIIWTSIALVFILIASCLAYVFISKVPECKVSIVNVTECTESMFRHQISQEHWLLKAQNYSQADHRLVWEDEWLGYRVERERILDQTNMWMVIREKGVYLVYIQANFILRTEKNSSSTVELKIIVDLSYDGKKEMFSAAHDTQVVSDNSPDAKLNTFLLMKLQSTSQLSVRVFPSHLVNYQPRPFSTFITIIKWADNW
uniref:Si:dkey-220k22.3 n=1 Tax=Cyprinus carpio carpio TaxID=630221 RepID=A0A9J8DK56_CYPCA